MTDRYPTSKQDKGDTYETMTRADLRALFVVDGGSAPASFAARGVAAREAKTEAGGGGTSNGAGDDDCGVTASTSSCSTSS